MNPGKVLKVNLVAGNTYFNDDVLLDLDDCNDDALLLVRPKIERIAPFRNMEFFIVGKLSRGKDKMKLEIMRLGGRLGTRIHNRTAAVISTQSMILS